ncbi:hypothetical protein ABZX93_35155 [Streptomyces sp. NPDC006632]|uniref:hypothetical protein n=1 Tax=Streptomyces sp. NPDC006632 TaxID=3157182 RepID=UPI0033AE88D0
MSTAARRRLGTGPTTTRTTPDTPAARLLPAERGESAGDAEHQDVTEPTRGRRILGPGIERAAR